MGDRVFELRTDHVDAFDHRVSRAFACCGGDDIGGLGPVGVAFLLWDIGMKGGSVPLLGVLSYASPIVSTALLVVLGLAHASWSLAIACALMVAAAMIATRAD